MDLRIALYSCGTPYIRKSPYSVICALDLDAYERMARRREGGSSPGSRAGAPQGPTLTPAAAALAIWLNAWAARELAASPGDPVTIEYYLWSDERGLEAERERRAKIISAEGEYQASPRLADAAQVLSTRPATMQLRYLQPLLEIAAEKNSTTIFPVPLEFLRVFVGKEGSGK
jgi:hypothetical protein